MKKKLITTLIILAILGVGGFFGIRIYRKHQLNANPVKVFPVAAMDFGYFGENTSEFDGTVVVNNQQSVYVSQNSVISELKAYEGMLVHPGDVLLTYDMTSSNLELDMLNAQLYRYQVRVTVLQHELTELKNTVPLEDRPPEPEPQPQPEPEPQPQPQPEPDPKPDPKPDPNASPTDATPEKKEEATTENKPAEPTTENKPADPTTETGEPGGKNPEDVPAPIPTRAELQKSIRAKEKEINTASYQVEVQKLKIQKKERQLAGGEVRATITGVVQKADVSDDVISAGEPAIVVVSQQAVTVRIYVNEIAVKKMKLGDYAQMYSYEASEYYSGTVTEIGEEPDPNYYGNSEYPTSWYPVIVSVDEDPEKQKLKNNDWVTVTVSSSEDVEDESTDKIAIPVCMVKEENGTSYVMKEKNGHLVRQNVGTGKNFYGSYVEITSGLSKSDYIAFPYSADAVEGKAVIERQDLNELDR